jgi:hypothetical protein
MATAWVTGVCLQPNRLEWTVLRRVKEAWEVADQGQALRPETEGAGERWTAAALKPHLRRFKGAISVALPTDRVLLRVALLPSTDPEELRGMGELQADKFSPFPVETMALGSEVLDASETSSLMAMAVVRREEVEAAGTPFQEAGAPPDVVDVEVLGWWWGLKHCGHVPAHGSQIFLRAEAAGLHMVVARDGMPLLFRALTPLPSAEVEAARSEWVAECTEEMTYSLTALETEWGGGGSLTLHVFAAAELPVDWVATLQQALGLEEGFTHALEKLPTASEGIARRLAAPARPLALDLAPEEWRTADAERRTRRRLLRAATVFLAVWLLGIGAFWTLLNLQRGRLTRLQVQVEAIEPPAREIRRLRGKVLEFAQYADRTHSALESLRVVSGALPAGMDLTSFVYRKGSTLALRGEAESPDRVYGFIQALERLEVFPEVKSEGVSTRNTPQGSRSQFGITIRLPGTGEGES